VSSAAFLQRAPLGPVWTVISARSRIALRQGARGRLRRGPSTGGA
jgi:hypothetical protein